MAGTVFVGGVANAADDVTSPAEMKKTLDELNKLLNEDIAATRRSCAMGQAPEWVLAKRAHYGSSGLFPDASDMCVAVLGGIAGDRHLADFYHELLSQLGGDVAGAGRWPRVIGAAVLSGKTQVEIGNRKAIDVTPAIAFDAGFTVAYQDGNAGKSGTVSAAKLKAFAEGCLGQHESVGTCFSAGYMYGAHAFDGRVAFTN